MLLEGPVRHQQGSQDRAYDAAYSKYESASFVHQIADTFNSSFNNVQNIMSKYQSGELVNELSSVLSNTKTSLQELFSQDPGLFEPTQ